MRVTRRTVGIVLAALTLSGGVATPAHAATPAIRLASPSATWHAGSTQSDGTNSSVHLAADVTGLTPAEIAAISVRFSAKPVGGVASSIGTDATAPFSFEWTPAAGTYDITADVLDNTGTVTATTTTAGVAVSGTTAAVHVAAPSEGALLGWYRPSGATAGLVAVSGTRSASGPAVDVSLGTTWNPAATGSAPASASQTWTLAAPVTPTPAPTGDTPGLTTSTWLTAAAIDTGVTTSDEAIPVTLYLQRVTGATVASSVTGAKNTDIPISVAVTDQFGRPIVGLPVTGTATGGTTVITGANTDATGTAIITARNSTASSSTITLSTRYGATFDPLVDRQATTTLSTYTAIPTSLVVSSAPAGPVLSPAAYNSAVLTATLRDQFGTLLAGATVNAKETVTRTSAGASTTKQWSTGAGLAATTNAQGQLTLAHDPSLNATGTDTVDVYLEQDAIAGRTAGDLGAAALAMQWSTPTLTLDPCAVATCASQQHTNVAATYTVREGFGATPSAGRTLALAITSGAGASFTPSQPSNTTRTSATAAVCTTDSAGACTFTVSDTTVETAVVRVSDTGPSAASGAPAATLTLSIRARSVAFNNVVAINTAVIDPLGTFAGTAARPGDALVYRATARDIANLPLANIRVSVTVDHGFFTNNTSDGSTSFGKLTFNPAPVNGGVVTLPVNLGSTMSVLTDSAGALTVTVALGRDAALDATGVVSLTPSFAANGVVATAAALGTFTTDAARLPLGARDPLNRAATASLTITDQVATRSLTGFAALGQTRAVLIQVRDGFGNLARPASPLTLSLSGVGTLGTASRVASYTGDQRPISLSSTVAGNSSLSASLGMSITTFAVSGTSVSVTTRSTTQTATAGPLQWYLPVTTPAGGATYVVTRTPLANVYALGTAVAFHLTAKDQHGQPLKGVGVTIDRVGPGNVSPGHFVLTTDATGTVAYSLSGALQGNLTVQFVAVAGGVQVFRSITPIAFDAVPTIAAPAGRVGVGTVLVAGLTRGGASVVLQMKPYGGLAFTTVATTKASATGAYSFLPVLGRHATFRVVADRVAISAPVFVRMQLRAVLTLTSLGGRLTANVATSPRTRSAVVMFYTVAADGTKHRIGSATTDRFGRATASWSYKTGTVLKLVAYVHGVRGINGNWTAATTHRV